MRVVAGATVVVLGAVLALVWFGQRSLMYHPDRSTPPPAATVLDGGQDVTFTTADGLDLTAWHVPATPGCVTVLVAPGNGGNRAMRAPLAQALADQGWGVLLLDYRGYAGNPGAPTQSGLARDVRAAREWLVRDAGAEHLVYLGESLGTGVVTELAAEHPPVALVLRSPFTSMSAVADAVYGVPLGWLLRDRFPTTEHLRSVQVPVAVVLGEQDRLVPPQMSRDVAEIARAGGAPVLEVAVAGADHNDAELSWGTDLLEAVGDAVALAGRACGSEG
ncbi:hypothetical protein N869_06765 [Cellulomonas bogoriensis 69B4 = DSM 16987]|uniref:AB hydrolase-1 domain-containing protein n=2 Tax=Cellulomonas bogoriensis TaxID=301388 RepID=A0A0A0BLW3_9CELL|nr:hypothetical protein N869_06765 [Cellulomonas bogoriensis 69B4 = DSM 16987]